MRQYRDYRHQMEGLPSSSPVRKKIKQDLGDFLESVRDKYGQRVVDVICGAKRMKSKSAKELLVIFREVGLHP